jgi:FixJ family two-component response regulator
LLTLTARTDRLPQVPVVSIIDDDASVRVATNRLVRSLGYIAHAFASADDFLRSPHVNTTSCVITDIQMPGMSGVELQSLLCAQGRRVPIIFITAFPEEKTRARALDAGAVCFLTKPFEVSALIKYLDMALGKSDGGTDG